MRRRTGRMAGPRTAVIGNSLARADTAMSLNAICFSRTFGILPHLAPLGIFRGAVGHSSKRQFWPLRRQFLAPLLVVEGVILGIPHFIFWALGLYV